MEIKKGKYQHYNGNFYEVIGEGKHSETQEELVIYKALYDSEESGKDAVWVRPKKMFLEYVDGRPRFNYVEKITERPKIGAAAIIIKDGKVLLQKRINSRGHGTRSFPGGHLEFNEEFEECAKRETFEEMGIKIKNVRFTAITNDVLSESQHYITIFMLAEVEEGEPKIMEPDKSEQLGWFRWEELPQPLFTPVQNLISQGYKPF